MVATINNGGGFYRVETYVHEAKMHGGNVHPPCVNTSNIETIIQGKDIYLGFQHLQGLEKQSMIKLINARVHEPFRSLQDFMERVPLGIEQLDILIRIDAFRSFGKDKRTLLWEAFYQHNHIHLDDLQQRLFSLKTKRFNLPPFSITDLENAFDQLELLHFTLYDNFLLLEHPPTNDLVNADLPSYLNKVITIYGYLVTAKNTSTSKGERMHFGTFLDQKGQWLDTVIFPPVARKYPFRGKGIYRIIGKVVKEFDFLSIETIKQERMPYIPDPRFSVDHVNSTEQQKISVPSRRAYRKLIGN